MLKTILAISGKPGLYKLISQGKNMLIVESVSADKKRSPIYASDKVISLGDIAMYTDADEVPLSEALEAVIEAVNGSNERLIYEGSDMLYHLIVLLTAKGMRIEQMAAELQERHNPGWKKH